MQRLSEAGLLRAGGRQRTDATHVLAAVSLLSRLELVAERLRAALEELVEAAPAWLTPLIAPEWGKRYGRKVEIGKLPGGKAAVTERAEQTGWDGQTILAAAWAASAPPYLRLLPQVEILRQVWVHHHYWDVRGRLRWRDGHALPPASLRHLTESCDEQRPELAVHVATTPSTVQDVEMTRTIHDDLAERELLPREHVMDSGYITPAHIERAHRIHGITLLGPVVPDHSRQTKAGSGFAKAAFPIDWDRQQATCPQGAVSREWRPLRISGHDYIQVKFAKADCLACPVRPQCTSSATRPRALALPTRELHEIQMCNRLERTTTEWQRRYAIRAGIEATLSQNVRAHGLRRSRYRDLAKTHVQHVLTALVCNVARIAAWVNTAPTARRRSSHFRALCTTAA